MNEAFTKITSWRNNGYIMNVSSLYVSSFNISSFYHECLTIYDRLIARHVWNTLMCEAFMCEAFHTWREQRLWNKMNVKWPIHIHGTLTKCPRAFRNALFTFEMPSSHSKCPLHIRNALFTFEMPSSHSEFEMPSSHSECPLHIYNTIIYKSHSWKDHRHLRYAIITYMTFSLFVGIVWSHMAFVAIANESCHTYECVMSHETNKQRHARKQVISHMWMSHVTHVNEACHTYEWSI